MTSVGEQLPIEMARVRDKLLPIYDEIPTGIFAATQMRWWLDEAAKALAEGDIVRILVAYEQLKGFEL